MTHLNIVLLLDRMVRSHYGKCYLLNCNCCRISVFYNVTALANWLLNWEFSVSNYVVRMEMIMSRNTIDWCEIRSCVRNSAIKINTLRNYLISFFLSCNKLRRNVFDYVWVFLSCRILSTNTAMIRKIHPRGTSTCLRFSFCSKILHSP